MNTYIFHAHKLAEHYNCSGRSYQEWQALGTPNVPLALVYGVEGIVYWASYLPFILVFIKSDLLKHSCYKIMFWLAIFDVICIPVSCFLPAYFTYHGMVYCMSPRVMYFVGSFGLALWGCTSSTCMILALNRCLDLTHPRIVQFLFGGRRTYFWLVIPFAYATYFLFFHTTICFTTKLYAYFFDPFVGMPERNGTVDSEHYPHMFHSVHNFVVAAFLTSCYGTFCICLSLQVRGVSTKQVTRLQRQTFLQSFVICSGVFVSTLVYIYMQFLPTPLWLVIFAQICWQFSNGIIGFTYFFLNPTMRRAACKIFRSAKIAVGTQKYTGGLSETIVTTYA